MPRFVVRLIAAAVALGVATWLVDGIDVTATDTGSQVVTLLVVAVLFGALHAVAKPLVTLLSLPLVVLTLGLFLLVVNGAMLLLVSALAGALALDFEVTGLVPAILGAIVIAVTSFAIDVALPDRYERR